MVVGYSSGAGFQDSNYRLLIMEKKIGLIYCKGIHIFDFTVNNRGQ